MARDIKNALISQIEELRNMPAEEMQFAISSIVDSLSSSRVSIRCTVAERSSPVPAYNHAEDGDYSSWLVANNID